NPKTGWAIHVPGRWNVDRRATFWFARPAGFPGLNRWTVRLDQHYGGQHTLGRFRVSLGRKYPNDTPLAERRQQNLREHFRAWLARETERAKRWTVLHPLEAKSNLPLLTVLEDGSVLASGDTSKRDVYDLRFHTDVRGITALRLEVLPHDSLPKH